MQSNHQDQFFGIKDRVCNNTQMFVRALNINAVGRKCPTVLNSRLEVRAFSRSSSLSHYQSQIAECTSDYERAIEILDSLDDLRPNIAIYTGVISVCGRVGRVEEALEIFQRCLKDHCTPTTATYNALISAFARKGRWQKAVELLHEMSDKTANLKPDVITLSAVLSAYEKAGKAEEALALLGEMESRYGVRPNVFSYSSAISACVSGCGRSN